MKQILIPMDFTEISLNAFDYAHTRYPHEQLNVLHISPSLPGRDNSYTKERLSKNAVLKRELEKAIIKKLNLQQLPDNVKVEVLFGDIISTIKEYVNENNIEFLVMGTRDKHDFFDRWFGTNSLAIIKTLKIPVYLVPRYGKNKDLEQVLVASDHHLKDPNVISFIRNWNRDRSSFIKFLHIKTKANDDFENEKEAIISELFKNGEPEFGFEISSVNSSSVTDSLLASAYNLGADLMIIFPENMNFMQSMVFRSVSKEIIQKSTIPLLFVHQ